MDPELKESTNMLPISESHVDKSIEEETSVPVDVLPIAVSAKSAAALKMGEAGRRNLILYAVGIFVCYFYYGILQEKITKGKYGEGENQEKFHFTLALVCVQCIINAIFAQFAKTAYQRERDTTPRRLYAMCSLTYLGAMLASNHALQHVAYPTQVLGKSIKPIPVMILGVLLARKSYPLLKYMCVLLIVIGVALFMYKDQKQSTAADHAGIGTGEILLASSRFNITDFGIPLQVNGNLISLTLDGLTGASQDRMRSEYKTVSYSMMLMVNVWSILWLSVALLMTGEAFEFAAFASRHPMVLFNMIMFSLASAIGQTFIFLTVTIYGPLMCSIVTTTRKFFTILGSVIIFQNPMSSRQWLGTGFVFMGLALDSVYGKEKKNR